MSNYNMSSISTRILSLLTDQSFPPLVMLDGDWGEGKTYYTKNILIPELEDSGENCVFLSLTGLSSISDFKDRLLSASLLKKEINSEQGNAISSILGSLITQFGGEKGGTAASLLGSATGLIKETMLARINGKTIIIDDLDRVSRSSLCDLIIGECLQLSDSGNLKFIFVVNDKKSLAGKALKEKVFSGIVKLNRSVFEAVDIAFSCYDWYLEFKDDVIKIVSAKALKNLRVLKRASKNINEIYMLLQTDDSLDLRRCMSCVITAAVLVTFYHYEKGLSESDIWDKSEYSKVNANEKNEYSDLVEVRSFLTLELISYCVGGTNWRLSIEDLGRLPRKSCPIDTFLFAAHFQLEDEEFENSVNTLYTFVFEEINVPFSKWFEAAYFYYFLQSKSFFTQDRPNLDSNFDKIVGEKKFDYSDLDGRAHRLRINAEDNFVYRKYVTERNSYRANQQQEKQSNVFQRMKDGWGNVDIEIYQEYQLSPFFNQLPITLLEDCIRTWSNKELLFFNDFISDRYRASNIRDYLSDELATIEQLHKYVNGLLNQHTYGRRRGALGFLATNLESAIQSLELKEC